MEINKAKDTNRYAITFNQRHYNRVLKDFFDKLSSTFWVVSEINMDKMQMNEDWESITEKEQFLLKGILSFFATGDGLVTKNIDKNLTTNILELSGCWHFQGFQETVHNITYSELIKNIIPTNNINSKNDAKEHLEVVNMASKIKSIDNICKWTEKWINNKENDPGKLLVAFIALEGIIFSGCFCVIYWYKTRNMFLGLTEANEFIARDEFNHALLYSYVLNNLVTNKPSKEDIKKILIEGTTYACEFMKEIFGVGNNEDSIFEMKEIETLSYKKVETYIQSVCNEMCEMLCIDPIYKDSKCEFEFMLQHASTADNIRKNFFENRVNQYQNLDNEPMPKGISMNAIR